MRQVVFGGSGVSSKYLLESDEVERIFLIIDGIPLNVHDRLMDWDPDEPFPSDAIFCCGDSFHINVENILELMPQVFPLVSLSKGLISSATIEDIYHLQFLQYLQNFAWPNFGRRFGQNINAPASRIPLANQIFFTNLIKN